VDKNIEINRAKTSHHQRNLCYGNVNLAARLQLGVISLWNYRYILANFS